MKNLKKSKRNLYLLETPFEKMLLIENLLNNLSYFYNSLPSLKNKQSKIEKIFIVYPFVLQKDLFIVKIITFAVKNT